MDSKNISQKWTEIEEEINRLLKEGDPSIKDLIKTLYPLADKKGKKFLKKVAHILKTRGIEVEIPEETREPVWKPVQAVKKVLCASFDGTGIMPIAFSLKKGDYQASVVAIHYRFGIQEIIIDEKGLREDPIPSLKNKWENAGFIVYEMPYEHGLYHLKRALSRGKKRLPSFISYEELKNLDYDPSNQIPFDRGSPVTSLIMDLEDILFEIHHYLPVAVLLYEDEISKYIEEYINISSSPIVLTSWTKKEREKELFKKIIDEVIENKKDAYYDFFIECGIIAMKKGLFDTAGMLKRWAMEIKDETIPSEEKSIFRSIINASLEFWAETAEEETSIITP
jgi:hypothetical protein